MCVRRGVELIRAKAGRLFFHPASPASPLPPPLLPPTSSGNEAAGLFTASPRARGARPWPGRRGGGGLRTCPGLIVCPQAHTPTRGDLQSPPPPSPPRVHPFSAYAHVYWPKKEGGRRGGGRGVRPEEEWEEGSCGRALGAWVWVDEGGLGGEGGGERRLWGDGVLIGAPSPSPPPFRRSASCISLPSPPFPSPPPSPAHLSPAQDLLCPSPHSFLHVPRQGVVRGGRASVLGVAQGACKLSAPLHLPRPSQGVIPPIRPITLPSIPLKRRGMSRPFSLP